LSERSASATVLETTTAQRFRSGFDRMRINYLNASATASPITR
jgi:hypothetical protein